MTYVDGTHTTAPMTVTKRRSAARSASSPFCSVTMGRVSAAGSALPLTGCHAQSSMTAATCWVLVAITRTSEPVRASPSGPDTVGASTVWDPSGVK